MPHPEERGDGLRRVGRPRLPRLHDLGGVGGEWSIVPGSDATRVLLFFHGGGYCSGSTLSHRRMVTEAGRAAGARTLAVGYRLAPEHPFPAALDDAMTAWRFLRGQGVAAAHVAIGGDSAGGGLTAALINRLRETRDELPACAWLVSPWTDLTMSGSTLASKDAVDPLIHKSYLVELAEAYLPRGFRPSIRTCEGFRRRWCKWDRTRRCSMTPCALRPPPAPPMWPRPWRSGRT